MTRRDRIMDLRCRAWRSYQAHRKAGRVGHADQAFGRLTRLDSILHKMERAEENKSPDSHDPVC